MSSFKVTATLPASGYKGSSNHISSYGFIAGVLDKKKLVISSKNWKHCRDEATRDIAVMLRSFTNIDVDLHSSNWKLEFTKNFSGNNHYLNEELNMYAQALLTSLLGETNKGYSPLASPYILRWLVGKVRTVANLKDERIIDRVRQIPNDDFAALRRYTNRFCRDYFYKVMKEADKRGMVLNDNFREAWQVEAHLLCGHMGLDALRRHKAAAMNRIKYEEAFPPSVLVGEVVK